MTYEPINTSHKQLKCQRFVDWNFDLTSFTVYEVWLNKHCFDDDENPQLSSTA